jgi:dephospho-CoA kinase
MKLLGLTGGIGMGKSAAADCFRQLGLPVVDTDVLARELVAPGQPALAEIRQAFGPVVVDDSGGLRRDVLARIVFADVIRRRRLEGILHPRIRDAWLAQAEAWRAEGRPAGVVAIPLLFETQAAGQFAATICVACTAASQRERLRARGWSAEEINLRLAAQWPVEQKMAAADFVVWAEGGLANTAAQIERILARLGLDRLKSRVEPQTTAAAGV